MQEVASGDDRLAVRRPRIQKAVNGVEKPLALAVVESGRDAEDPDPGFVGQLRNVNAWHSITIPHVSFAKLVQRFKGTGQQSEPQPDPLRVATAAVLLEIAYADGTFTPAEDGDVVGYLKRAFALAEDEARDLLTQAGELRARTIDHFALTHFIRKNSTLAQRIDIVKTMWRIVYSDRKLTDYENYLVRKLADLLGLEHHVMIDAKVDVLRELGLST